MNNKPYKCMHCKRNLGNPVPHKCRGNWRKRKLSFKDRRYGREIFIDEMLARIFGRRIKR